MTAEPKRTSTLPLFPLPLVLFPGMRLPLRIFESRYIDLVRDCSRTGSGFGVVYLEPAEDQRRARHAEVGTEAMIEDFTTLEDGLLGIETRGSRRFRIHSTSARDNGLLMAEVSWLGAEPAVPVSGAFGVLGTLYREIVARTDSAQVPDADPDDAGSLGMALAALLPIQPAEAQIALELHDARERLAYLLSLLEISTHDPDADDWESNESDEPDSEDPGSDDSDTDRST